MLMNDMNLWLILMFLGQASALSFNQPKLCSNAVWSPNATTFTNTSTIGTYAYDFFITTNNSVYVYNKDNGQLIILLGESAVPSYNMSISGRAIYTFFVTTTDDIYMDNYNTLGGVGKWRFNSTPSTLIMSTNDSCTGLFVDINNTLYCSVYGLHQIVKKSLNNNSSPVIVAAGTGVSGNAANMLNSPQGIFVDINLDLYVADRDNNRIQLFRYGQLNGTTVASNESIPYAVKLYRPTGVVLDADKNIFIADEGNNRIVGLRQNGFQCLAGCNRSGLLSDQLNDPWCLHFDSFGNIFIADRGNNQIQKFILSTNSCDLDDTTVAPTTTQGEITSTVQQMLATSEISTEQQAITEMTGTSMITTTSTTTITMTSTTIITMTSTTTIRSLTCFSPTIILIPGGSTLSFPLQFRRNQDFYIASMIQLNCNDTLSTLTQWTVTNCTLNCSNQIQLDQTISTTLSELYIPARTLAYGTYQLQFTVTMSNFSWLTASSAVYVRITPSGIVVNPVPLGTSMITSGPQVDLKLDPGAYSVDPDQDIFNSTIWKYEYYCRIYGPYLFPNIGGLLLPFENSTIDPSNPSCLSNRTDNQTAWRYGDSIESSLTIFAGSLQSNRTYQFMIRMSNRLNSSVQATGYVLVKVVDTPSPLIVIGCVISTMCIPNLEFQLVNPTTQVALLSDCVGNCSTIQNMTWNIFYGSTNATSNITQWNLYNQTTSYANIWFFGINTSRFTATNQLFLAYPQINRWRFEVVYSFLSKTGISALNFIVNQPPYNGSCSISPLSGTTSTLFTILCPSWFDQDGIQDYSLYSWTTDPSQRTIIAFSPISSFQVRLPAGDNQTSPIHLIVDIRDQSDCATEYNISSVLITWDLAGMNDLIDGIQNSPSGITTNSIVQLLASKNQNIVAQVITSSSQLLNQFSDEYLSEVVSNGIPATRVSISPLNSESFPTTSIAWNDSALSEFNKQINRYASTREYLIQFTANLPVTISKSIELQSFALAELTKATNQLTRTTLIAASDKCQRLSLALYSMATTIAFEDVQTAAAQLMRCSANVLDAVSGPLQQRTNGLDVDSARAQAFPDDYETDLESEWSNSNLFADGNDFSWNSVAEGRNLYYQRQLANQILNQMNQMTSSLTSSLNNHLNIGQDFLVNTSEVFMSLNKKSIQSLSSLQIQQAGNVHTQFPASFQANISGNAVVLIRCIMEPLAPFGNSKFSPNTNLSTSISVTILDENENEVLITTNSTEIVIPRDPNVIIPPMTIQNVTATSSTPNNQLFHLHYANVTSVLPISIHLEIHPLNSSVAYLLIYKFDQLPRLNSSVNQIDGWTVLCPSNAANGSIYRQFLDNQQTSGHRSLVFGLRELNSTEVITFCSTSSPINPPRINQRFDFTCNYELRIYSSGCYYLDPNNQWQSDGLRVGPLTNHYQTQCFSTHLTTFAGGFIVLPEPVNWSYVFANADFMKNKTVYLTVICVLVIYVLLILYARLYDKKDLEKLGVTPLPDNHQSDEYFYQIIVVTGHRRDAGTKSQVHFILYGNEDETHIRTLADPHRPILQRGGIDAFIMAVPRSLGFLNCIRIWHDNSGPDSSSSWFLKYLIVRDLQTMEKFHFISQQWFAVEKDDGKIERVLPVAGVIEMSEFSYLLSKQTYYSVSDGHLWFSIFSRPPSNRFTRVQRCTCCFVLLFLSMFLNIMYYDQSNEKKTNQTASFSIGSFSIPSEQISIGITVEILALIPSLLIVQLFQRIQSRHQSTSSLRQALYRIRPNLEMKSQQVKKHCSPLAFPWWCLFIVYGICLLVVVLSVFFIIVRGIEFGDLKTQHWLISIVSGFSSSVLLTQPIKILCLAVFFAFFCRKQGDGKEMNEYLGGDRIELNANEDYRHSTRNKSFFTYRPTVRAHRLNEAEVLCARNRRLKQLYMWSIIREIATYLSFLSLVFILIYSNRNSNSFLQVNHLRKYFVNSRQTDVDYTKIATINEYWKWLEGSFVSNIRAQQWYNGDRPRNLSGFINDKSNRLIGWATMRQLRIKSDLCSLPKMGLTCEYDYSVFNEERRSFDPGWQNETSRKSNSTIDRPFEYRSKDELDTYDCQGDHGSYSGGGYVYEFRGRLAEIRNNLSELHREGWIDRQTRAVLIQFTLYNPNVRLFTSVTLLTEFLSTGGIYPQSRFEPASFDALTSTFQLICMIFYMVFIIYFALMEARSFARLKRSYFYEFWSWVEVGIIVCSWMGVVIHVWNSREYTRISHLFKKTNGYAYVNLQFSTYVNNFSVWIYGFCCFFGTVKLIRLCRFNRRLYLFVHTLKQSGRELVSFGAMFFIVFFAFICLFYFLFQSKLWICSSVYQTAEALFEMILMKFDAHQLSEAAPLLAPLCFSLFILLVVFVCLSMFVAIITDSFRQARENIHRGYDEEIYWFMLDRFLRWTGWRKPTEEEIFEERDVLMRPEYYDPIERFPEKIDQLLDALNRIYITQGNTTSKR